MCEQGTIAVRDRLDETFGGDDARQQFHADRGPNVATNNMKPWQFKIDFHNGDVFDYLRHLAKGMLAACGY